jgi:hypothetical protein
MNEWSLTSANSVRFPGARRELSVLISKKTYNLCFAAGIGWLMIFGDKIVVVRNEETHEYSTFCTKFRLLEHLSK